MTSLPQLPQNCHLIELQRVGSTNDHARTLAKNGYPAGTVVWAHEQTAGRGRQGNSWASLAGNLFATIILRPVKNASLIGQLSFVTAVALARTLRPLLPQEVEISLKWPNDLLLNGRKSAGILLETELNGVHPVNWVLIGVGVNISAAPKGAASLGSFGVKNMDAALLLEKFTAELMACYKHWLDKGFEPVRQEWLASAHKIGEKIQVRLGKEKKTGKFTGIDRTGSLQLEGDDGQVQLITSGEVFTG